LQLETIDVFYLHNPETAASLTFSAATFYDRIPRAFEAMEQFVEKRTDPFLRRGHVDRLS